MKYSVPTLATLALSLTLTAGCIPSAAAQTNEQIRKDQQANAKQNRKADKAQAHADKEAHKALKSDKVKDAARAQDKADAEAAKTPNR
jgi:outer membrane murein-binding lipoprotein Lpp